MSIADIVSLVMAFVAMISVGLNWRKSKSETVSADASAASSYADAATKMAKLNEENQDRLDLMGKRLDEMKKLLDLRNETIIEFEKKIGVLTKQVEDRNQRIMELERMKDEMEKELSILRVRLEAVSQKQQ